MIARLLRKPILLILVALVAVQADVFLMGHTVLPLMLPGVTPGGPYEYTGPRPEMPFSISVDPAGAYDAEFAWNAYTIRSLRKGIVPLWNQYQGLGQPQFANYVSGVLYPVNWLAMVLPPAWWDLIFLVDWFLAAYFVYLLGRVCGLARHSALIGSLSVFAAGFFEGFLAVKSIVGTIAWFPFLIYAVERTVCQPAWKWRHAALVAGTYCLATAGHPAPALMGVVLVILYAVIRAAIARGSWRPFVFDILPAMLVGGLLAAPLWVSFAEHVLRDGVAVHGDDQGIRHFPWRGLPLTVFPFLYGPLNLDIWANENAGLTWNPAGMTFLALCGLFALRERRRAGLTSLAVVAGLAAAKIFGVPIVNDVGRLPLLNQFSFTYANGFVAIGLCMLAGAGFARLVRQPSRRWLLPLCVWAAYVVAMLGVGVVTMRGERPLLAREPWRLPYFYAALTSGLGWAIAFPAGLLAAARRSPSAHGPVLLIASSGLLLEAIACFPSGSPYGFVLVNGVAGAAFGGIVVVATGLGGRVRVRLALPAAALVAAVVVAVCAWIQPRLPGRYDPLTMPPYVDRLMRVANAPRLYPFDGILFPNFAAPFGLSSVTNLDNLVTRQGAAFFSRYLDAGVHPARFYGLAAARNPAFPDPVAEFWAHKRYWDFLGVRYLLTTGADPNTRPLLPGVSSPLHQEGDVLRAIDTDPRSGVTIWENPRAADRAFLAPAVETAADSDAAMARLDQVADLRRQVFIDGPGVCRGNSSWPPGADPGHLISLRVSPNRVDVRYDARSSGVLTLTDAHARGWCVLVDGREAQVLRVDGAFRGVCIDAPGEHLVEFIYRPPAWSVSLTLCGAGALGFAALVFVRRRTVQDRRRTA